MFTNCQRRTIIEYDFDDIKCKKTKRLLLTLQKDGYCNTLCYDNNKPYYDEICRDRIYDALDVPEYLTDTQEKIARKLLQEMEGMEIDNIIIYK